MHYDIMPKIVSIRYVLNNLWSLKDLGAQSQGVWDYMFWEL